jgi:hypothetical protein
MKIETIKTIIIIELFLILILGFYVIKQMETYKIGNFEISKSHLDDISETMEKEGFTTFQVCNIKKNICVKLGSLKGGSDGQ